MSDLLAPPKASFINPDHVVPVSPPPRPPFQHCLSSSTLPATPSTPWPGAATILAAPAPSRGRLGPFLSLLPRLLLTAASPCLLPLILTIAHLIQTRSSTATLAAELRSTLASACAGIATGAASLVALPRYLAMQTNDDAVRATQASILAVGAALIDVVDIMEEVLGFIVDCYRSVLLCTLQLAVQGTLDILIGAVELSVTSSLNSIRAEIQDGIASGNGVMQSAVSVINDVIHAVDSSVTLTVANITVPELAYLENVTIPSLFEDTLIKLNASMPTLTELKDLMTELIDTPFEALKSEINSTRLSMAASFNSSILPVPALSVLSTNEASSFQTALCGDLDTSLIDDTANALHKLGTVAIALLFLVLFIVWGVLAFWEWRRWRALQGMVQVLQAEWDRGGERDPWTVVAIVEHPMLERYAGPVIGKIGRTQSTRTNIRWFLSYLSHPTMLTLLFIATIGFIALEIQLAVLASIKDSVSGSANSTVSASADTLAARLNSYSANASASYAADFNAVIQSYESRMNNELFGSWVNTTATTLNTSLVEFYDEVEHLLNATFGGTILYSAINTFVYCLVGSKITNLETGLTWLAQHSQVTLPTLPVDVLQLSNSSMNELVQPVVGAAVGSGSGSGSDSDGVVGTLISHFESALRVERTVYAVLLGVYLALFLIGLAIVYWHSGGREHYVALHRRCLAARGLPVDGDTGGGGGGGVAGDKRAWPWKTTPIYDTHADGTDAKRAAPVPTIVEPTPTDSFLDYRRSGAASARLTRTLSALAAPGQAFLRMTGYQSEPGERGRATPLVQPGTSSEKYTRQTDTPTPAPAAARHVDTADAADPGLEPPPPIWVHRLHGAVDSVRGYLRGRALGASMLGRSASTRTERSFGASQVPTARTPRGWPHGPSPSLSSPPSPSAAGAGRAVDMAQSRALDPRFPVGLGQPRRLSRQPTGDGAWSWSAPGVPYMNAADAPSPLPRRAAADPFTSAARPDRADPFERWHDIHGASGDADGRPDSVDYLADTPVSARSAAGGPYGYADAAAAADADAERARAWSPAAASDRSYVWSVGSEPRVVRAETGTAALAAVFAGMDRRRRDEARRAAGRGEAARDPFADA